MKEADRFNAYIGDMIALGWNANGVPFEVILTMVRHCVNVVEYKHDLVCKELRVWFVDGSEIIFADDVE